MTPWASLNRILAILLKDLRDAVRDARILFAVLTPLAIGIFYSFAFDDDEPAQQAVIGVTEDTGETFVETLRSFTEPAVELEVRSLSDEEIRQEVAATDLDLGLILPPDFDAAVTSGLDPPLTVLVPEERTLAGDFVLATVDPALRQMAGQALPAQVTIESLAQNPEDQIALRHGWGPNLSRTRLIGHDDRDDRFDRDPNRSRRRDREENDRGIWRSSRRTGRSCWPRHCSD